MSVDGACGTIKISIWMGIIMVRIWGGKPNKKSIRLLQNDSGFTLATLLVISTTLMIMGAVILQGTLSVKGALNENYYNGLAKEAAEAGVKYAQACIDQAATWTELRPDTTCTGATNGTAPSYVVQTDTYRTTFTVGTLDTRADGSTIVSARGKTELLRRESSAVYSTYNETLTQAVGASSMTVIPQETTIGGSALSDTMGFMLGLDGQVYGMGSNGSGRLGDGTTTNRNVPTRFKLPAGLFAKKVSAAYHFTAVLASDGQVYMAGDNVSGQLGDGTTADRSTPVKFQLPAGIFATDVMAGGGSSGCSCGYDTYVLASNGRIYGSGNNSFGQLTGTTSPQLTPKLLPLPAGVTRIKKMAMTRTTNNNNSFIVLGTNGSVYGTGENSYYQLGNSDGLNKTSFVQLSLPAGIIAADIQVGYYNTYVLATNGNVYGFGKGFAGQLGNGSNTTRNATVQLFDPPGSLTAQKMYASSSSEVAETNSNDQNSMYIIASDHQVYGAGQNHKGQLGNGATANSSTPVKFNLPAGLTAQDVSTQYYTTCVLASNKQVYCAGENAYGQMGLNNTTNQSTPAVLLKHPVYHRLGGVDRSLPLLDRLLN
ncbi:regulator of chromosome condensation RCC1 [candidate division TM7 genomosp. GTL1]|nr:regulator of chromosome condensation RCC1 [candidate division TM7 genomosp. GTL1]